MRTAPVILSLLVASIGLLSCGGGEEQPAQTPQQPPPGYYQPQQQNPGYAQPAPGQPAPSQPAPAQPAPAQPAPAQPAPGAAGAPGQPGMGNFFPCQTDANCIAHKCDTAAGRCIVPCQTNDHCQPGYKCMAPLCLPGQ